MKKRIYKGWLTKLLFIIAAIMVMVCCAVNDSGKKETLDKFEMIRTHIQTWLSEADADTIMPSSYLKETIVNDWDNQKSKYLIVSVRKEEDYSNAGHIPKAINIYWRDILKEGNIERLDSSKNLIIYCYFGHGSMICYSILGLLGYECFNLDYGMTDWNLDALVKESWDQEADYEVETMVNLSEQAYPLPDIESEQKDAKSIIKERAIKYLDEASPVMLSADAKAIIDDWDQKKIEYQIVSVRSKKNYEAGHVPHSINIPWQEIVELESLKKLDPKRTIIVYSDNGQRGQMVTTLLNLLGYKAVNIKFGIADWNKAYVEESMQWDGMAAYPVELEDQTPPSET